jgi:hypothetical protein
MAFKDDIVFVQYPPNAGSYKNETLATVTLRTNWGTS